MKPATKMFSETGSWYKGNLHSHTTNSDGRLTPEQSAAYYREHGYSFLCFSEHDYYTDLRTKLDRDDFITLPGPHQRSRRPGQKSPPHPWHFGNQTDAKRCRNQCFYL